MLLWCDDVLCFERELNDKGKLSDLVIQRVEFLRRGSSGQDGSAWDRAH